MTFPAGVRYASPVAAEEPSDTLDAEPDAPTSHDGDGEPDAGELEGAASASGEPTGGVRDLLATAYVDLGRLLADLEENELDASERDALLDGAHLAIVACLEGPRCPMCQGDGLLAIEPPADPRAERCTDCNGVGQVYTGSLVPESAVRPCGKCAGAGFTNVADVITPPAWQPPATPPVTDAQWYNADDPGTWHLPIDPAKRGQHVGA